MCRIIDGKALAQSLNEGMKTKVGNLREQFGRAPGLAMIVVGDNPASHSYVRGKIKAAEFIGISGKMIQMRDDVPEEELLGKIRELNEDPSIDGVLVQLPLPDHISKEKVINTISVSKDVDGFHPENVANLWLGRECTTPCTPKGIMSLIDSTGVEIEGKRAVVVGRSNIVGKPVAKLLMDRNATVTVAHSKTKDLSSVTREADILVVAVGHRGIVDGTMVKKGAIVIDVGINRLENGKIAGDVDFESVSKVAGYITPVPGGVGPMTITMLMKNTIECFLARNIRI